MGGNHVWEKKSKHVFNMGNVRLNITEEFMSHTAARHQGAHGGGGELSCHPFNHLYIESETYL